MFNILNRRLTNSTILISKSISQQVLNSRNVSSIIIPINDFKDSKYTQDEKTARCKLASLYRVIDKYGLTYGIYNHITLRTPDNPQQFFINALGLNYEEVSGSNLVRIDEKGKIIDRGTTKYSVNLAGFVLHSAIHAARPDLNCVIHVHTHAGAAVSTLKSGLLPLSQEALIRGTLLGYHEYDGILVDENFRKGLAKSLGSQKRLLMLHNHGLVSCGATVEEAWGHLFDLIYACETQYRAMAAAGSNIDNMHVPRKEVQRQVFEVLSKMGGVTMGEGGIKWGLGELEFEAEMRYLDYRGYKTGYPYKIKPQYLQE